MSIELSGEYHADVNLLLAKIEELENDQPKVVAESVEHIQKTFTRFVKANDGFVNHRFARSFSDWLRDEQIDLLKHEGPLR
ncbi:hypothetical protein N9937_00255 [bacterium]|nr:hypothetical protein [bacterium]